MSEIIPRPAGLSLAELAEALRACIWRQVEDELRFTIQAGAILNAGRAICESPSCGILGANPNIRFGKWVSETVSETPLARLDSRTASNYMAFARTFGHLPLSKAALVGRKHGYKLAHASERVKAAAIAKVEAGQRITPDDMSEWLDPPRRDPAIAAPVQPAPRAEAVSRPAAVVSKSDWPARLTAKQHAEMQADWTVWDYGYPPEYDGDYSFEEFVWLETEARRLATENEALRAEIAHLKASTGH
ncbi:hypothetical protein RM190_00515 [Paracoccus sp. CPCC 101403]|uniref:Uncharacterized protein n=1 Tax=Paracoccus broussonetiae TaxID=3075834 RepID=A0ABU3E7X3_9RHOB|nr:hypothetical protein [Paracoccus sp. CPCC 101403]MDT1060315.1 hypothetical protein [Paracoccus sp. CPCC 101403]